MKQAMATLTSSEHNEWYTPPKYIEMAREVLGEIDLDPASHPVPQQWIRAMQYLTREDSSYRRTWRGRVFLNPPYGKVGIHSRAGLWAAKLASEYLRDLVPAAILLTKTVPGYVWWDDLFAHIWPGPCCITWGRIPFINGEDPTQSGRAKMASTFWYCGPDPDRFRLVFSGVGRVLPRGQFTPGRRSL